MSPDPERMSREQLLARVYDLEARLEALEELTGGDDAAPYLQSTFGLEPTPARLLCLLMDGRPKHRDRLYNALYPDPDAAPSAKVIDVFICKLRARCRRWAIEIATIHGGTFHLTAGRELVVAAAGGEPVARPANLKETRPQRLRRRRGEKLDGLFAVIRAIEHGGRATFLAADIPAKLRGNLAQALGHLERRGSIAILKRPLRGRSLPWEVSIPP